MAGKGRFLWIENPVGVALRNFLEASSWAGPANVDSRSPEMHSTKSEE